MMVDTKLSRPEKSEDKEKISALRAVSPSGDVAAWRHQLIRAILRALVILGLLAIFVNGYADYVQGILWTIPLYLGAYAILALIAFWRRVPYALQAGILLFLLYGLGIFNAIRLGLSGDIGIFLLASSALAMLFFGRRGGALILAFCVLTLVAFGWAFSSGLLTVSGDDLLSATKSLGSWLSTAAVFLMLGILLVTSQNHLFVRLTDALTHSRSLGQELETERAGLEERVAERTRDLERRARYLAATTEVAHIAASVLDLQRLLSQAVILVSERFGFYHTGIFLLDSTGEWAVLQAASSEGGLAMLARGHQFQVGVEGIVGYVTGRGEPRIALDVGEDAVYFDNPDLPETRSEMALPLRARGEIVGALDVQSTEPEAFSAEDVAVLQTLADQVALAISNARLFEQVQESLEVERRAYGELSREAWRGLLRARPNLGFLRDKRGIYPIGEPEQAQIEAAPRTEEATPDESDERALAMPVKVRGHVIGVIDAHKPNDAGEWTPEQITLLETLADQLGIALDGARLYQDAQRRATRERLTREITDKMRRATNVEGIVQTAVDELFSVLGTSRTFVQLRATPSEQEDGDVDRKTRGRR